MAVDESEDYRKSLYKPHRPAIAQEERRLQILENQKRQRDDIINQRRSLLESLDESMDEAEPEAMDWTAPKKKLYKRSKIFADILMLSEWMRAVPINLEDDWLFVLCPLGQRTVVHASKGRTRMFAKNGKMISVFPSLLPGGNKECKTNSSVTLDCIWCRQTSTIFILDLISWGSQHCFNTDTEFRQFILKSRMEEMADASTKQDGNRYPLIALEYHSCDLSTMNEVLSRPNPLNLSVNPKTEIDGLLFYHKEAYCMPGVTPLVLWTKPFMVPELFGGDINVNFDLLKHPDNYENFLSFIENFERERNSRKKRRSKGSEQSLDSVDMEESAGSEEMIFKNDHS